MSTERKERKRHRSLVLTADSSSAGVASTTEHRRFGRYTLLYRFASGGMANVYLARLTGADGFEKLVAIKLVHEHLMSNRDFIDMFIDEARLVSRISHPNVVQVIELGKAMGTHFLAMEYVSGENVNSLLRRTQPSLPIAARIVSDAAAGLHAAHELRGRNGQLLEVVHRDVSPQNILISYDGSVKVVDFGIALARGNLHITDDGSVKGRFTHMAPEQARAGDVDRRADIFSLGVVLYELSTSRRLFKAKADAEALSQVLRCKVTPPSKVISSYPSELEAIVMRALQRDPSERFQTAQEMQVALERFVMRQSVDNPILSSALAEMMHGTFADRIDEKATLLRQAEEIVGDAVPSIEESSSASNQLPSISSLGTMSGATRARLWVVFGLMGALLIGLAIVVFARGERKRPAAAPAQLSRTQQASPREVVVHVEASPPEATIRIDSKPVSNPFSAKRQIADRTWTVEVTAAGHHPHRFSIPLKTGGRWVIALRPEEEAAPAKPPATGATTEAKASRLRRRAERKNLRTKPTRDRRAHKRTRKRTRKQLADDDVLVNPY